jgi:hypothetical protein
MLATQRKVWRRGYRMSQNGAERGLQHLKRHTLDFELRLSTGVNSSTRMIGRYTASARDHVQFQR